MQRYEAEPRGHLPWKREVELLVSDVLGIEPQTLGDLGRHYYKGLPALMRGSVGNEYLQPQIHRLIKTSHLTDRMFVAVFEAMAGWLEFNEQRGRVFLEHSLPSVVSFTSLYRYENEPRSMELSLRSLVSGVGEGTLQIISPLCPPYHYGLDRYGKLRHASGALQPMVGERFAVTAESLSRAFSPLTEHGVQVALQFWTYSGETGQIEHLVEMGQDVLEHYRGQEDEMFSSLRHAFEDLVSQAHTVVCSSGIRAEAKSIDREYGGSIHALATEFAQLFPSNLDYINGDPAVDHWLQARVGVHRNWLDFYVEEEESYRRKQRAILPPQPDTLVQSGLREGLLYLFLTQKAAAEEALMIDLETTHDYMVGSLRHYQAPCIMANAFDPAHPFHPLKVRQPFNIPERL